jgi:hypothetical protein
MSTTPVTVLDALETHVVACDGIAYLLTRCCQASATGTERGVACRACYAPLPEWMGWATLTGDREAATASLTWLLGKAWRITSDPAGILERTAADAMAKAWALPAAGFYLAQEVTA